MTSYPLHNKFDWKPIVFVLGFFVIWTSYVAFIYPQVVSLGADTLLYTLLHKAIKILVWIMPVFLYLRFVDGVNPFDYLKLRQKWKTGVLVAVIVSVLNFAIFVIQFGLPQLDKAHVTWSSILGTSIAVGFIEEILFRGFILQKLTLLTNFWVSNLLTSILFLLVHIIGWTLLGAVASLNLYSYLAIFIFSFVMGIIFHYSDSLWGCIIPHSLNDCFSVVLFAR